MFKHSEPYLSSGNARSWTKSLKLRNIKRCAVIECSIRTVEYDVSYFVTFERSVSKEIFKTLFDCDIILMLFPADSVCYKDDSFWTETEPSYYFVYF